MFARLLIFSSLALIVYNIIIKTSTHDQMRFTRLEINKIYKQVERFKNEIKMIINDN